MFLVWQNWETFEKHERATNVPGNMFSRFAKAFEVNKRTAFVFPVFVSEDYIDTNIYNNRTFFPFRQSRGVQEER